MRLRADCLPLYLSSEIYKVIEPLKPGEVIPHQVYIRDFADESIPDWTIRKIERHGPLTILTLLDPTTRGRRGPEGKESNVAKDVFFLPEKTLAGREYMYWDGCTPARHMLCDIRQHARKIAEKMLGKKRGSLAPDILSHEEDDYYQDEEGTNDDEHEEG